MENLAHTFEMDNIHIAIVEDHPEIRSGVSFLLNSHEGFSSDAYPNAEKALEGIKNSRPNVVLMDLNLPGMNGIECTRILRAKYPDIPIMICSAYDDDDHVFSALEAGANGYILKSAVADRLTKSIKELHQGGSPMSSEIAVKVIEKLRNPNKPQSRAISPEESSLTPRENEILDLLSEGYRHKEIGEKLFVSVNTIRTHVYNIYEKLHVQNRTEALNKTGRGFKQ
jgi:DNA-binding NarL/FixJ family response regulator